MPPPSVEHAVQMVYKYHAVFSKIHVESSSNLLQLVLDKKSRRNPVTVTFKSNPLFFHYFRHFSIIPNTVSITNRLSVIQIKFLLFSRYLYNALFLSHL